MKRFLLLIYLLMSVYDSHAIDTIELDYSFADSTNGWQADFADLPVDYDSLSFTLQADIRKLPDNLDDQNALFISGNNASDDLFMFYKKKVTGFKPNTKYRILFNIELASQYPTGSIGIGGSPANSVYLKAGIMNQEPVPIEKEGYFRMNIEKGNQANGGSDAITIGDIAKPDDGTNNYIIISRDNSSNPFIFITDDKGEAWLLFGTDSGFEGTTSLYYTQFHLQAEEIEEWTVVDNNKMIVDNFSLEQNYPNPFNPTTMIKYNISSEEHVTLTIYDLLGNKIQTLLDEKQSPGEYKIEFNGTDLPSGMYFYQLKAGPYKKMRAMTLIK